MLVWDKMIHLKWKVAVTSIWTFEVLVYSFKTSCYTLYWSYECKYETNGFDKVPPKVVYQPDSIEDMFDARVNKTRMLHSKKNNLCFQSVFWKKWQWNKVG